MKLIEAKNKLHEIGYCDFDLSEYNNEFFSILEKIKYVTNDKEYLEGFTNLRFDYHSDDDIMHVQSYENYKTFDLCNEKKVELLKKYSESGIAQIWMSKVFNSEINVNVKKIFYNILEYFYGKTEKDVNAGIQWTLYNEGCFLKDHNDGQGIEYQNTCAILIYLNEDWEQEWGGNLILRNTKNTNNNKEVAHRVIPKFGKVAIIDLETFDTAHAVEKVIGEHNRFTILAFMISKTKREKV